MCLYVSSFGIVIACTFQSIFKIIVCLKNIKLSFSEVFFDSFNILISKIKKSKKIILMQFFIKKYILKSIVNHNTNRSHTKNHNIFTIVQDIV